MAALAQRPTLCPGDPDPRLASLGIEHVWQAALYLPQSYLDCRDADTSALTLDARERRPIALTVASAYKTSSSPPRLQFAVTDGAGARYRATIFGDVQAWKSRLRQGERHLFLATGHEFGGAWSITVHELLPPKYEGRIIPVYPAPRARIEPQPLRSAIARLLPAAIEPAAAHVAEIFDDIAPVRCVLDALGASEWTLEQLLRQVHYPSDSIYIEPVRATLERMAALASLALARDGRPTRPNPIELPTLQARVNALPFACTEDQLAAIAAVVGDLASTVRPARRVVSGDCGVGKTAVAGVISAAAADAGRRVVVLFPSTLVAAQAHAEFGRWFRDVPATLVTGATGGNEDLSAPILMGTTALLNRAVPDVDVLIVDEQHRFGAIQREHFRGETTHLVELSATCIPRTQALIRFGHMSVTEMRQTHRAKFLESHLLVGREKARELMLELRHVVRSGSPVFVVYPKREGGVDDDDRKNLQAAAELWERFLPGLVQTLDGKDTAERKKAALDAVRDGSKPVLLCTTVVEVGVDVAPLRHIVIVDPQNYGLSQLHQLRGRLARTGGEGWCYLLAPDGLAPQARDRLQPFLETTDGFKLAEADLRMRGAGDLSVGAERQHGADAGFLLGTRIPLETYDEVVPLLEELRPQ